VLIGTAMGPTRKVSEAQATKDRKGARLTIPPTVLVRADQLIEMTDELARYRSLLTAA